MHPGEVDMPREDDFDPREAYPFVDKVLREDDEHDPELERYQSGLSESDRPRLED
jgi:hypothetical protein